MGCCNCGCSLCGSLGDNLRTLKVVELYVCSYQDCTSSFLTLDEVAKHKLEHGQLKRSKKISANGQILADSIPPLFPSADGSVSLPKCQVALQRVDQVLGLAASSFAKSSKNMHLFNEDTVLKEEEPNYMPGNQPQEPVTNKESFPNVSTNQADSATGGLKRLKTLSSLSVAKAPGLSGLKSWTGSTEKEIPGVPDVKYQDAGQANSSAGVEEKFSTVPIQSRTNSASNTNVAGTEGEEDRFDSLSEFVSSNIDQVTNFNNIDINDDNMEDENFDVPEIESEHEDFVPKFNKIQTKKVKRVNIKDSFRCMIWPCIYQTKSCSELEIHETEKHFKWAHEACSANISRASDMLVEAESKWSCSKCEQKVFSKHEDATLHVINDHDLGGLDVAKCKDCAFTAKHPTLLVKHYKVEHNLQGTTMVMPKQKYASPADRIETLGKLRLQCDDLRDYKVYRCHICGPARSAPYKTEEGLQKHLHFVHNAAGRDWQQWKVCVVCGKKVKRLTIHFRQCHPEHYEQNKVQKVIPPKFFCDKCPFTTSKKAFLAHHQRLHEAKIVCSLCGKSYFKHKAKFHMETYHSNLKCTKCEAILEGYQALNMHMRVKHTDFCEPCGYPVDVNFEHKCAAVLGPSKPKAEEIMLGKKVKIFSNRILFMPDKCYLCLECGFRGSEVQMIRHDRTMHKHIPCNHCHVTCLGRAKLIEHMRICHPLVCIFCGTPRVDSEHSCAQVISGDQSFFQHIPVKYRPNFCRICFEKVSYGIEYRKHLAKKHDVKVEAMKAKPKGNQQVLNQSLFRRQSESPYC